MHLMTFNLRFENPLDGENAWNLRRELVIDTIRSVRPTLLGTQEGTPAQLAFLVERLSEYAMHAPGRLWDDSCQYPTLFCRRDALRALDGAEFWLSETPDMHRSKSWGSAFPRMMSHGRFEEIATGRTFIAAVTHLDHIGEDARYCQSKMVADWLADAEGARVLMGDFNDFPDSRVHDVIACEPCGLVDTWEAMNRTESNLSMTSHDFSGNPRKCRMDWIFVSREFEVVDACIRRDHLGGRYPSDHFPYAAKVRLSGE